MADQRFLALIALTVLLVACPASESVERADWRLAEPAQGDRVTVVVAIPSAATCGSFGHVEVSETPDTVSVRTFVRRRVPGPGEGCTDDLGFEQVGVDLEQDLGGRRLDGCDAPPEDSPYFSEPVPPEGCVGAVQGR